MGIIIENSGNIKENNDYEVKGEIPSTTRGAHEDSGLSITGCECNHPGHEWRRPTIDPTPSAERETTH